MDGLLIKLLQTGSNEPRFWKLFNSIRQDLDRMFWFFSHQPWMGAPDDFCKDDLESYEGAGSSSGQLWRPGGLCRYADKFREEYFDLWAIEPTRDDPKELAAIFEKLPRCDKNKFIEEHARIWLLYTDSSCWEIYARKTNLLDNLREALWNLKTVSLYKSQSNQRGSAFGSAGLSLIWRALKG